MIQTKYNTVYIFEIKFSHHAVDVKVIQELQDKIERLKLPRHMSYRCVLIHVNGVTDSVINTEYFFKIINFGQLLNSDEF